MEAASSSDEESAPRPVQEAGSSSLSYAAAVRFQADEAVPVGSKRKTGRRAATKHKRKPSCTVPAAPPVVPAAAHGPLPMVSDMATTAISESYTDDEKALNTFQKLHPLLSLEATSQRALQLVANLIDTTEIPTVEMSCIPKSYDDRFLAPPSALTGERACCLGGKCIAVWMAIFRYGEPNDKGFVCKEFLTPDQLRVFEDTGKLPKEPAKCLLCSRYYQTYQYKIARCDPNFVTDARIPVQAYTNVMGHTTGETVPTSASFVGGADGYHPRVCLAVDSDFANTEAGRGPMGTMLWRPFVAFHSGNYKYKLTEGRQSIVQVGQPRVPIHEDFAASGVVAALWRQERWVKAQFPSLLASADMSSDLTDCNVSVPSNSASALRTLRTFRRARVVLDSVLSGGGLPDRLSEPEIDCSEIDGVMLLNMARVSYGDMLESSTRLRASKHCTGDELPLLSKSLRVFPRLMMDSYLIACWTSAHAEWLDARSATDRLARRLYMNPNTLAVPGASMSLVPYAITSQPDLGGLFERRVPCKTATKSASAMTALLTRCTNAGSRGWDSTLQEALLDTDGCTKIMFNVMVATCTGMHTMLHPMNRPCWEDRMRIHRLMCTLEAKTFLSESGSASKETARMYMAHILANMPATREAMLAAGHPAGHLVVSPFELPPVALVAGLTQMLRAARRQCIVPATEASTLTLRWFAHELFASLSDEQKKRRSTTNKNKAATVAIVYSNSWLGRSQPLCVKGQRLIGSATNLFLPSFKADFLPMWYYQATQGHRVSRLDSAQHRELHANNPALLLCKALDDEKSLAVQRLALRDKRIGIMTLAQAAALLGVVPSPQSCTSSSGKCAWNIVDMQAEEAAKVLTLARVSAAAAQLLTYNLGERTRRLQVDAVCRRLMAPRREDETDAQAIARLPKTSTHMMLCVECRRVANACQDGSGKECTFNEVGISSSMLRVEGELKDGHMRCAKRSSAALRTALQLEEDSRCVSCNRGEPQTTAIVPFDSNGMMSRIRRDVKAVYDQVGAAISCGGQPLVSVFVVGRVINVFNQFYALCSYCGCLCTVEPSNRYGAEICCTRCDFKMLYRDRQPGVTTTPVLPTVKCRFCGREETTTTSANRFKIVSTPTDTVGHNKDLPAPLRWCAFCSAHYRPWLQSSLHVMNMKEVFSHISSRCRPVFAAAGGQKGIEYTNGGLKETAIVVAAAPKRGRSKSVARMLRKGRPQAGISKSDRKSKWP